MNEWEETGALREMPEAITEFSVPDAVQDLVQSNDLNKAEAAWIEELFRRIAELEDNQPGHDAARTVSEGYSVISEAAAVEYQVLEAAQEWHFQEGENSCAVCSQQFIINEFLDLNITERQLCTIAEANGWLDAEQGTSLANADNLLELFGIEAHTDYTASFADLKKTLDEGGRAVVAVDSMVLWTDGAGNYPVYGADHAIEVVGIDDSGPGAAKILINDSGIENGCAKAVPIHEFMEAWQPSGGFMISAYPGDGKAGETSNDIQRV